MKSLAKASACLLIFVLGGCAATASFTQTGDTYPAYQEPVKVFFEIPEVDYERVGIVSSQGGNVHSRADMLNAMQKKAAEYGANAIIVVSEQNKDELIFSASQFGAFGGTATTKNASAVAVRIPTDSESRVDVEAQNYQQPWHDTFSAGASVNGLYFGLGGYGANAWFGKKRIRAVAEYYSVDTPAALLRDGFANGEAEWAYSLEGQYFLLEKLSGPYFSTGLEYMKNSVGYEGTTARGKWEDFLFSAGAGYLLRFNRHLYLDAKVSLNASFYNRTVDVGREEFQPDRAVPSAFIGVGANF